MKKSIETESAIFPAKFILFLAFFEGAFVIFAELIGAKKLAFFYGNSLAIWTSIITVTISFLTLGYYVASFYTKSNNPKKILSNLFIFSAFLLIIFSSWSVKLYIKFENLELLRASIQTSILLIGPPVFFLGMTSPILIQEIDKHYKSAGKSSGMIYSISTFAGIIATIVLGYFFLPNFGIEIPLIIAFLLLSAISFYLDRKWYQIIIFLIGLYFAFSPFFEIKENNKYFVEKYHSEGLMGQLKVFEQSFPSSNVKFKVLSINGIPQTIIHDEDKNASSFWLYVHKISAVASLYNGGNALLFGMGGGVIANELQKQNFKLDIVDIDKRMFEISKEYFYFKPKSTTNFYVDDARHYIKTCKKKYDYIVIDICTGEVQPSNVFTSEGISELKKLLNKNGMIIIQYQEKINPNLLSGSQSIAKTFNYQKFYVNQNIENLDIASIILSCSLNKIDFNKLDTLKMTENVRKQKWLGDFVKSSFTKVNVNPKNSVLLVDDKPILEQINAETIQLWRKSMNDFYLKRIYNVKD